MELVQRVWVVDILENCNRRFSVQLKTISANTDKSHTRTPNPTWRVTRVLLLSALFELYSEKLLKDALNDDEENVHIINERSK